KHSTTPLNRGNPGGQMDGHGPDVTPPDHLPETGAPVSRVVWVLTPSEQAGPMGFGVSPGEEQAASFIKERLDKNEPVMVIIGASMSQRFGQVSRYRGSSNRLAYRCRPIR
ncbi:MAG: hypothetical protein HC898_07570, partial [Phycisphaerales bacterium]|nr:hypothetical protein [Phycisphaerales bacterium]